VNVLHIAKPVEDIFLALLFLVMDVQMFKYVYGKQIKFQKDYKKWERQKWGIHKHKHPENEGHK